jgi:glycosyltransferase involved in cell wall biosynthesis
VLIESLACGTPVVASNIPGVRTVVDHSNDGMLVSLNEQHELTDVLLQMLGQPTNRSIMGARGRAKVLHHYDWNLIGVRLEGLYLEVLHSSALAQHKLLRGKQ